MNNFVLKRKFINYVMLFLLTCAFFGLFISTLVLTILKQIEMVMIPIFLGIMFILMLLALIDSARTRIIINGKELIIKKDIFKTINLNINSISEISISLFFNDKKRSIVRSILFYDNKKNLITKINSFEIDSLDNFEEFINYLNENEIELTRKTKDLAVDIKKNMILIISASIVTILLFLAILIFLDTTFNSYKNTKYDELIYLNDKIKKIETYDDDINVYFNNDEYYLIPSSLDFDKALHIDDDLDIYYKKINDKNIVFELYDNGILYYSYDYFISKTIKYQNLTRTLISAVILIEMTVPLIFYFVLTGSEKRKLKYYNSLDSKYKKDFEGIIKYKLTNFKETIKYKKEIEKHMLSKIVIDGISYFIIEYDKKDITDYYIGYSYCGKKALIDAFIEDDKIFLEDELEFMINGEKTEFLDAEKEIFETYFNDIEIVTKHKPYYMSQYDEIEENN